MNRYTFSNSTPRAGSVVTYYGELCFRRNAERMRYRTFLTARYQIGSGMMEATCKLVVHQRLDQSGMQWHLETADAIVALRVNQLSRCPRDLRAYCVNWS